MSLVAGAQETPTPAPVPLPPMPKPVSGGDYWTRSDQSWPTWKVVTGPLPGRRPDNFPANWQEPGALLNVRWNIAKWPAVLEFPQGYVLTALPDGVGTNIVKDDDGSNWLRVTAEGQLCFVRCNKKWIQPCLPK